VGASLFIIYTEVKNKLHYILRNWGAATSVKVKNIFRKKEIFRCN